MVYDQSEILDNVKNYYENLYSCNDANLVNVDLENIIYNYNSNIYGIIMFKAGSLIAIYQIYVFNVSLRIAFGPKAQ